MESCWYVPLADEEAVFSGTTLMTLMVSKTRGLFSAVRNASCGDANISRGTGLEYRCESPNQNFRSIPKKKKSPNLFSLCLFRIARRAITMLRSGWITQLDTKEQLTHLLPQ